jgi:hypothetical protein
MAHEMIFLIILTKNIFILLCQCNFISGIIINVHMQYKSIQFSNEILFLLSKFDFLKCLFIMNNSICLNIIYYLKTTNEFFLNILFIYDKKFQTRYEIFMIAKSII